VALSEAATIGADHEWDVDVRRRLEAEDPRDGPLAKRARKQIVATYDLTDAHRMVIEDDRQLVRGRVVRFGDDKVAEHFQRLSLQPAQQVCERIASPHAKTPAEGPPGQRSSIGGGAIGAGAGISGPFLACVRGAGGRFDVRARARAGINELGRFEQLKGDDVTLTPGGLDIRSVWSPDIRAEVPIEAEPAEVIERLLCGPGFHARRIDVFQTKDDYSAL